MANDRDTMRNDEAIGDTTDEDVVGRANEDEDEFEDAEDDDAEDVDDLDEAETDGE